MSDQRSRDEREARLHDDGAHVFPLTSTIATLRGEEAYGKSGRSGITLVKNPDLRVVLQVLRQGAELAPHAAPGPITVQVLEGELRFSAAGEDVSLRPGELLALPHGTHSVEAVTDSAFLLTIAPANRE
ncbi:MAG TPA: cupin domain-containing protein [Armatimonadota bacterium]|nr:cupin domain-containing protein [Armatimonadota bacterium]